MGAPHDSPGNGTRNQTSPQAKDSEADARMRKRSANAKTLCFKVRKAGRPVVIEPSGSTQELSARTSLVPSSWVNGREEAWRLPSLDSLFKSMSDTDQRRLTPSASEKGDTDRQTEYESQGHSDVRIAGDRCGGRTAACIAVSVHQISDPRWPTRGCDKRVEF